MELAHGTGLFANCRASVVEKSVGFAGKIWKPSRKLAFVVAEFCHSLPFSNSKGRCFTAATLANSAPTAVLHGFNFNHMLEFYEASRDQYCGAIAAVECAAKADAIALEKAGKSAAMRVLFAMWRKAAGVEEALEEIASESGKTASDAAAPKWKTSMECEWPMIESALYDGTNFTSWADASEEMRACVTPDEVKDFKGTKLLLAMGGMDGMVNFTGGGLTKYPADTNAGIEQVAASDKRKIVVAFGWPEYSQAVASAKDDVWDGEEEHKHDIQSGGARSATAAVAAPVVSSTERKEEGPMKISEIVRLLRERANAVAGKDDPLAKDLTAWATAMEAELAAASTANAVEETIAARIKSGDLVPKDVHAKAVADASAAGTAVGKKEVEDRIAGEKKAAEVTASRLKAVTDAGLKPEFPLRKDVTIANVVASIPANEAGDKDFTGRLEEWVNLMKATGQAKASAGNETGSATIPPTAGGSTGTAGDLPARAYG
ncbi:MAG: hypothetical protein A2W31_06790 [Planctomycetes bacterium RBG_16_64_10]|nr:MAG: hypothetical protein A2W31_06790 [Planctomycetes bacterium RBG_16_64_10]